MKKTYFHGTCADNLPFILENGLVCDDTKVWSCSRDAVYLWDSEKLVEYECREDDELNQDEVLQIGFRFASESAKFAAATSKDCRLVVVEVSIDESEVCMDDSHENMGHASCVYRNILPEEITSIRISNDLSLLKGYFLAQALRNDLFDDWGISRIERKVSEVFSSAEIFIDDVEDMIEWDIVNIPQLS